MPQKISTDSLPWSDALKDSSGAFRQLTSQNSDLVKSIVGQLGAHLKSFKKVVDNKSDSKPVQQANKRVTEAVNRLDKTVNKLTINVDNLTKIISNINKITSNNRSQLLQANRSNNLLNAQQRAITSTPYNSRLSGASRGKNFVVDPRYTTQQPSGAGGLLSGLGSLRNKLIMGGVGAAAAGLAYYNWNTIKKQLPASQPQQPGWYPPNIIPPNAPVPPHLRSWVPTQTPNSPNVSGPNGPGLLQGIPPNGPRGQSMLPPVGVPRGQPMLGGAPNSTPNQATRIPNSLTPPGSPPLPPNYTTPLTAGPNGKINPVDFYNRTVHKVTNSPLNGTVPAWGKQFGITTGSPHEWARFFTMLQQQESGHRTANVNPDGSLQKFPTTPAGEESYGPGQFKPGEYGLKTWGDVNDPDKVIDAYINVGTKDKIPKYFGSVQRPNETLQHSSWFDKNIAPFVRQQGQTMMQPDVKDNSSTAGIGMPFGKFGNNGVQGLIVHHTAGRGTPEGVVSTFKQRGFPAQFIMDRNGDVQRVMPEGARGAHMKPGQGVGQGFGNWNTEGIEVIAKNNRDWTDSQRNKMAKFVFDHAAKHGYDPRSRVFGHGEVNPHKEKDEGEFFTGWFRANYDRLKKEYESANGKLPQNTATVPQATKQDKANDPMRHIDDVFPQDDAIKKQIADGIRNPDGSLNYSKMPNAKGAGMLDTGSGMLDPEKGSRYLEGTDAWIEKSRQYSRITKYNRQINEPGLYKYGGSSSLAATAAARAAMAAAEARRIAAAKAEESQRQMPAPTTSIDPKQEYIDKSAVQEKIPTPQPEPAQQAAPPPAAPQPTAKEPEQKADTGGDTKNAWAPNVMEYWKQGKQGIHV